MATMLIIGFLFFAHVAGQSTAWYCTWPIYGLWGISGAWALIQGQRIGSQAMLALVAMMVSVAVSGINPEWGYRRWATIVGYGAVYYWLAGKRLNLAPALAIAGAVMSLVVVGGISVGNRNIVAGFIFLTVPAAMNWHNHQRWYTLALGGIALYLLGSRGAWLAVVVAMIIYNRLWIALTMVPGLAFASIWLRPHSVADRLQMWASALQDLTFFGHGLGTAIYPSLNGYLFYHTHCVPLTVVVETGIPGLAALVWGLWRLVPRLTRGWQGATLAGLLAWSLVDGMIWFWGPGLAAVYLLSEVMRDA
jgi:hypothetical protein